MGPEPFLGVSSYYLVCRLSGLNQVTPTFMNELMGLIFKLVILLSLTEVTGLLITIGLI